MRRLVTPAILCAATLAAPAVLAQTWTGNTDGTWNTAGNWTNPSGVPTSSNNTQILFGSATTTAMTDNIAGTFILNSTTFSAGAPAYTLTGNALNFKTSTGNVAPVLAMSSDNAVTVGDAISLSNPLAVNGTGTGTVTLTGVVSGTGGLTYAGAGTLVLKNTANTYSGGTTVAGGTLSIGATGNMLPAASAVTVQSGAVLDYGPYTQSTALSTLSLIGGTLRATGATSSDLSAQQLVMTGGTIDFTSLPFTWLHIYGTSGITTNASSTTATWIASPGQDTRMFNDDGANAMSITVAAGTTPSGIDLDAGLVLACRSASGSFTKLGAGTMRLTNTGNTAAISVQQGTLRVDDMAALGSGSVTLTGGTLAYGGPTASSNKLIGNNPSGTIRVLTPGVNLTLTAGVVDNGAASALTVLGSGVPGQPSTLTFTSTEGYSNGTTVAGQAVLAFSAPNTFVNQIPNGKGFILGDPVLGRGDLLFTGAASTFSDGGMPLSVNGLYAANGGGALGVQDPASTITWGSQITGSGSLIKTGAGTLRLTTIIGANTNSYAGGTYVEAGTLVASGPTSLPPNSDVTVFAGGMFKPAPNNAANVLHSVTLTGGTLLLQDHAAGYYVAALTLTGGTVDGTAATGNTLFLTGPAGITSNTSSATDTITLSDTPTTGLQNDSGQPTAIKVAGGAPSGVDLDLFAPLTYTGAAGTNPTFVKTGAGVVRLNSVNSNANLVVNQGKVLVDSAAALGTGALSLTGGTLQYGGATDTLTKAFTLDAGTSGIEVMQPGTILTLTTPIAGGGGLAVRGAGQVFLPSGSTYTGGTTIDGITFPSNGDDTMFGAPSGGVSVDNAGTLFYAATASTGRTFTLDSGGTIQVAAGKTLTLAGGRVNGGFLAGPGTFAVTGGTALTGGTTYASTPVSVTGAASFVNFSNGGPLTVAAPAASPAAFIRFTNAGSGSITVGAGSQVNVSDFQSYGTVTLNPGSFNGTSGNVTQLTNTGSSMLYFNGGSRTFISTAAQAANINAGIDLHGFDAEVAGGLFVNNGYIIDSTGGGHRIVADFGAVVKGAGFYQTIPQTINGGTFSTGNSPGGATAGAVVLGGPNDPNQGLSNYTWQINDAGPSSTFPAASGAAGPTPNAAKQVSGWSLLTAVAGTSPVATTGNFDWDATPTDKLTIHLTTLLAPDDVNGNAGAGGGYGQTGDNTAGLMSDFDPTKSYVWKLFAYQGTYTGPTDTATLDASTVIDDSGFLNPHNGRFDLVLNPAAQELDLTFTPSAVPEPGTLALVAGAVAAGGLWRRRGAVSAG